MKALFDYAESLHKTGKVELPNLENFPPHSYSLNAIRNQRRKMEDRHAINPDVGMILPKFQAGGFFFHLPILQFKLFMANNLLP